jgi:hypothetical protein
MTLVISKGITLAKATQPLDADAQAYVNAVEVADGQRIEDPVRFAINNFVLGCKADGIWNAIKASCILAGARTLNGALVPLVGAAPTNVGGLFTASDYDRKTGLKGNRSSKALLSNYTIPSDSFPSFHASAFISERDPTPRVAYLSGLGTNSNLTLETGVAVAHRAFHRCLQSGSADQTAGFYGSDNRLYGFTRDSLSTYVAHPGGSRSATYVAPLGLSPALFASQSSTGTLSLFSSARLSFYSIGSLLSFTQLNARVTTLINAFAAAIP